jgi:8-oxo-dGTP pyrophosphatase MutT (NUDIX family)
MDYARRSGRVLLMDSLDRLLLFRFPWKPQDLSQGYLWITPGGGRDEGEQPHETAARELWEETGLRVAPESLLPQVGFTEGYADLGWQRGIFRDDFFFHRTAEFTVDASLQEEWERTQMTEFRWWPLPELKTTQEFIVPLGVTGLLDELLAGLVPVVPRELPWHH